MRKTLLFLACFMVLQTVYAEIHCGLTLEWLADTCPYVGIYKFQRSSSLSPDVLKVEAILVDGLRGSPPQTVSFMSLSPTARRNEKGTALQNGDKFMVFLRDAGTNDTRLEEVISLTKPFRGGELRAALEPDFTVLDDAAAIEKVIRTRIAAKPLTPLPWREYPANRFRLEIPAGTPAYSAVFGGSSCYLIVPDDLLPISEAHLPAKPNQALQPTAGAGIVPAEPGR